MRIDVIEIEWMGANPVRRPPLDDHALVEHHRVPEGSSGAGMPAARHCGPRRTTARAA